MSKKIIKIVVHYSDDTTDEIPNIHNTWTMPTRDPNTFTWPINPVTPWTINQCSKCGIELHKVMGYVCSHMGCPTGMGPTVC